jgi:hypothetical protein
MINGTGNGLIHGQMEQLRKISGKTANLLNEISKIKKPPDF